MSKISRFFEGKSVVLSGVTGFIGGAIAEKLLRSCPGMSKIYCLTQAKNESSPVERIEAIRDSLPIFQFVKGAAWDKIKSIEFDPRREMLGINKNNLEILKENANIFINAGGRVNFKHSLRKSADMHFWSVSNLMSVAEMCKNVEAFVQISSMAVSLDQDDRELHERIYPTRITVDDFIHLLRTSDDKHLDEIGPYLTVSWKYVPIMHYSLCKSLAENHLSQRCKSLGIPLVIVRGPHVQNTAREPTPGMIDGGAEFLLSRVILALAEGTIQQIRGDPEHDMEWVPLDVYVNTAIVSAWDAVENGSYTKPHIYNAMSMDIHPCPKRILEENIWRVFDRPNRMNENIFNPSKPHDYDYGENVLEKLADTYIRIQPVVKSEEWAKLMDRMSPVDKEKFWMDLRQLDWAEYTRNVCLGLKKYAQADNIK